MEELPPEKLEHYKSIFKVLCEACGLENYKLILHTEEKTDTENE